jgi:transcription elongation GreA/GreB family factor
MMRKAVGDVAVLQTPDGEFDIELLDIKYETEQ